MLQLNISSKKNKQNHASYIGFCFYKSLIRDKKGTDNVVVDHLSRLTHLALDKLNEISKAFPDEKLYTITSKNTLWFADYANYLAGGAIPKHLNFQQRKNSSPT